MQVLPHQDSEGNPTMESNAEVAQRRGGGIVFRFESKGKHGKVEVTHLYHRDDLDTLHFQLNLILRYYDATGGIAYDLAEPAGNQVVVEVLR